MKACVTGATGCVGRNIVDELVEAGWDVVALHRRSSDVRRLRGVRVELREVDLHDPESVLAAVPEGMDAIFHAAANVSHWPLEAEMQWRDNVLATRNLISAAKIHRVGRFIFTSTMATYEHAHKSPEEAARISCSYIRSKLLSEFEVRAGIAMGVDAVILRPAIILGRYDYNNYSTIFQRLHARKLSVVLPGIIEFSHAREVAWAHRMAFERGRTGEAYFLHGNSTDWLDVYQRIARIMAVPAPARKTPLWLLYALAYPMLAYSYLSRKRPLLTPQLLDLLKPECTATHAEEVAKTVADLGYRPSSIDGILADCYAWMLEEGLIRSHGSRPTMA